MSHDQVQLKVIKVSAARFGNGRVLDTFIWPAVGSARSHFFTTNSGHEQTRFGKLGYILIWSEDGPKNLPDTARNKWALTQFFDPNLGPTWTVALAQNGLLFLGQSTARPIIISRFNRKPLFTSMALSWVKTIIRECISWQENIKTTRFHFYGI